MAETHFDDHENVSRYTQHQKKNLQPRKLTQESTEGRQNEDQIVAH